MRFRMTSTEGVIAIEGIVNKFSINPMIEGKIRDLLLRMSFDYQKYIFYRSSREIFYAIETDHNYHFEYNSKRYVIDYVKEIEQPKFAALTSQERAEVSKYVCYIIYLIRLGYEFPDTKKDIQKNTVEFDVSSIPNNGSDWKKTTNILYQSIVSKFSRNTMLSLTTNRTIRIFKFVEWEEGKLFAHHLYDILYELYEYEATGYSLADIDEIFDIYANHAKHLPTIKPHVSYKYVFGLYGGDNRKPDEPMEVNPYYGKYSTYVGQPWYLQSGKLFVPIRIPWCSDCPGMSVFLTAEDHLTTNIYLFMRRYLGLV